MKWPLIDEGLLTGLGLGFIAVLLSGISDRATDALRGWAGHHQTSQDGLPSYDVRQDFTVKLSPGNRGIFETLYWMAQLVRRDIHDPMVRAQALDIVENFHGHDFDNEIDALFRFVRDRITYRRDPVDQERVQDTRRTLFEFQSGDCDDKVVALASLLGAIGHRSRFCVCGHTADNFSHVYLQVDAGGQWKSLDPTDERAVPGWETTAPYKCAYEIW